MSPLAQPITAGFMPLLDSLSLVLAREKGFAADEGIALTLVRETSWANIRDRVAVGHFEAAHMLAPMPIAAALGLNPLPASVIAPMALGLGGNAVTTSRPLWNRLLEAGGPGDLAAAPVGTALRQVVQAGGERLRFAVVHPHSGHNYELRYWLAASGINPDRDLEITVLPPSLMPEALGQGSIDGYCVGEPWNSIGVSRGGRIATVKAAIWRSSPEKVLGVAEPWALAHPDELAALIRAIYRAAQWADAPANRDEAAAILARPEYLDLPAEIVRRGLSGRLDVGGETQQVSDFFVPFARAATFPWQSHALWFYSQMVRWRQVSHSSAAALRAGATYRPDLYRAALGPLSAPVPGANAKVEGALQEETLVGVMHGRLSLGPDGFFDGRVFDPSELEAYLGADRPHD